MAKKAIIEFNNRFSIDSKHTMELYEVVVTLQTFPGKKKVTA
jgi:hypothetical protein